MPLPPPRLELFSDPVLDPIWAAIKEVDPTLLPELLDELTASLAGIHVPTSERELKTIRAVRALREAAKILERSPTVGEYEALCVDHPDWPPERSVRAWLGEGSWNNALGRAKLSSVPDGDALVIELGGAFTADEVIAALVEATVELSEVPGIQRYLAWARRPNVRRRPGRRPRSQPPFDRLFGGYLNALIAAGLVSGVSAAELPASTLARAGKYFQSDADIRSALREVAERIGRSPRTTEYPFYRQLILDKSRARGILRALPSLHTIQRRYGTWDAALVDAGLEPLGGRHTRSSPRPRRPAGPRYSDEDILHAIRSAFVAVGVPFTVTAYLVGETKSFSERGSSKRLTGAEIKPRRQTPRLSGQSPISDPLPLRHLRLTRPLWNRQRRRTARSAPRRLHLTHGVPQPEGHRHSVDLRSAVPRGRGTAVEEELD